MRAQASARPPRAVSPDKAPRSFWRTWPAARCGKLPPAWIRPHEADVFNLEAVEPLVGAAVDRFARLDVLANNAGIASTGSVTAAAVEDWRRIMAIDVDGVFHCIRAAAPHRLKTHGCIANVSSVSGPAATGT